MSLRRGVAWPIDTQRGMYQKGCQAFGPLVERARVNCVMSTVSALRERRQGFYDAEVGEDWPAPTEPAAGNRETFADRWSSEDPIYELIEQLAATGRAQEANLIERILGRANQVSEDEMVRGLVSAHWATHWDSAEDSIYDE